MAGIGTENCLRFGSWGKALRLGTGLRFGQTGSVDGDERGSALMLMRVANYEVGEWGYARRSTVLRNASTHSTRVVQDAIDDVMHWGSDGASG